jgi:catechol 2,3-dioxygenase-like lactoylglutathione lyase family enzyme
VRRGRPAGAPFPSAPWQRPSAARSRGFSQERANRTAARSSGPPTVSHGATGIRARRPKPPNESWTVPEKIALPFTSRTYVAIAIARGIAAGRGNSELTGCHVVLGLLREGGTPALGALERAGISLQALRSDLETALPERGHPTFGEILLPATDGERAIVEIALSEAIARLDEYVGGEHLLLALLRDPSSTVGELLSRHGITYAFATDHLRALFSGAAPTRDDGPGLGASSFSLPVEEMGTSMASVRYFVNDVDGAVSFYVDRLAFTLEVRPAPSFAIVSRDGLRLLLSLPAGPGGAAQAMPDGRKPEPGGWNRIRLETADLDADVARLRGLGTRFRNQPVSGFGGKQVLLEDPSGNPIELFEPPTREQGS